MKKIVLVFIIPLMVQTVQAQDPIYGDYRGKIFNSRESDKRDTLKMNPDGYIGGITFNIEPGFDFVTGAKLEEDTEGKLLPLIPQFIGQNVSITNPSLKFKILFPLSINHTFFLSANLNWYKEEGTRNDYFLYWKFKYTRFSISGGFNIYLKPFSK